MRSLLQAGLLLYPRPPGQEPIGEIQALAKATPEIIGGKKAKIVLDETVVWVKSRQNGANPTTSPLDAIYSVEQPVYYLGRKIPGDPADVPPLPDGIKPWESMRRPGSYDMYVITRLQHPFTGQTGKQLVTDTRTATVPMP